MLQFPAGILKNGVGKAVVASALGFVGFLTGYLEQEWDQGLKDGGLDPAPGWDRRDPADFGGNGELGWGFGGSQCGSSMGKAGEEHGEGNPEGGKGRAGTSRIPQAVNIPEAKFPWNQGIQSTWILQTWSDLLALPCPAPALPGISPAIPIFGIRGE